MRPTSWPTRSPLSLLNTGRLNGRRSRTILERSAIFASPGTLIDDVCKQMEEHRLIRIDGSRIVTTARARRYLSLNLSMIHDERKVPVYDMVSRRTVGTLDESFVVGWVHPGAVLSPRASSGGCLRSPREGLPLNPQRKRSGNSLRGKASRSRSYNVALEVGEEGGTGMSATILTGKRTSAMP